MGHGPRARRRDAGQPLDAGWRADRCRELVRQGPGLDLGFSWRHIGFAHGRPAEDIRRMAVHARRRVAESPDDCVLPLQEGDRKAGARRGPPARCVVAGSCARLFRRPRPGERSGMRLPALAGRDRAPLLLRRSRPVLRKYGCSSSSWWQVWSSWTCTTCNAGAVWCFSGGGAGGGPFHRSF